MLIKLSRSRQTLPLLGYIMLLFVSAAVRDVWIVPYVTHHMSIATACIEPLWKLLFWLLPSFLYVRYIECSHPWTYLKLTTNLRAGLIWGVGGSFLTVVVVGGMAGLNLLLHRHVSLHPFSFDDWLNGVLLVGIMEEIPFRGVLFQVLHRRMPFWQASGLTTVFFALVHVPLWISQGLSTANIFASFYVVGLVGWCYCFAFKRSGSLWASILIHSVYDACTTLLS
jgi:membrane protease YdiL (CAAX protease family)